MHRSIYYLTLTTLWDSLVSHIRLYPAFAPLLPNHSYLPLLPHSAHRFPHTLDFCVTSSALCCLLVAFVRFVSIPFIVLPYSSLVRPGLVFVLSLSCPLLTAVPWTVVCVYHVC